MLLKFSCIYVSLVHLNEVNFRKNELATQSKLKPQSNLFQMKIKTFSIPSSFPLALLAYVHPSILS